MIVNIFISRSGANSTIQSWAETLIAIRNMLAMLLGVWERDPPALKEDVVHHHLNSSLLYSVGLDNFNSLLGISTRLWRKLITWICKSPDFRIVSISWLSQLHFWVLFNMLGRQPLCMRPNYLWTTMMVSAHPMVILQVSSVKQCYLVAFQKHDFSVLGCNGLRE